MSVVIVVRIIDKDVTQTSKILKKDKKGISNNAFSNRGNIPSLFHKLRTNGFRNLLQKLFARFWENVWLTLKCEIIYYTNERRMAD